MHLLAKVFVCSTMADEIQKILPPGMDIELLPYALHRVPKKLNRELQDRINSDNEHDTLLFAYGLCSYGVVNLHSSRHILVIPKVHDCISLLMGSRADYDRQFAQFPGTFYLSKGWIDQGADPLAEHKRNRDEYGEENARWMTETQYGHYQRVVFIDTGVGDTTELKTYVDEVAQSIGVPSHVQCGSLRLIHKLLAGEWDDEFVVVPPGRMVMQRSFL